MNYDKQMIIYTTFNVMDIWGDVDTEMMNEIISVFPKCFEEGTKDYEEIEGYADLPWKVKHHLDIRIEMFNDVIN